MTTLATLRRLALCGLLLGGALRAVPAAAQALPFYAGFTALPAFAWPQAIDPAIGDPERWSGSYASVSTGFAASSSKRLGSYAGPTVGFEGGRLWQEGRFVYGLVGGFDYIAPLGGGATPGFGGLAYTRDLAGAFQVQAGFLVTPDVLVYAKAGAVAVHEEWRWRPASTPFSFSRDDIVVRPDARVGVEWAVTDRLSVAVEAGVVGRAFR